MPSAWMKMDPPPWQTLMYPVAALECIARQDSTVPGGRIECNQHLRAGGESRRSLAGPAESFLRQFFSQRYGSSGALIHHDSC